MSAQEIAGIAGIIGALTAAYIAWRKLGPESTGITVSTADRVNTMTLRFAGEVAEDNDDLRAQIAELRREFAEYRRDTDARLAEYSVGLVAERAEKEQVKRENVELLRRVTKAEGRVDELEAEVKALKSGRS